MDLKEVVIFQFLTSSSDTSSSIWEAWAQVPVRSFFNIADTLQPKNVAAISAFAPLTPSERNCASSARHKVITPNLSLTNLKYAAWAYANDENVSYSINALLYQRRSSTIISQHGLGKQIHELFISKAAYNFVTHTSHQMDFVNCPFLRLFIRRACSATLLAWDGFWPRSWNSPLLRNTIGLAWSVF